MDNENYEESNFKKNLKAIFNRVKLSNFISLLVVIGMVIVFSLWSIGWDPTQIGWEVFLVNLAFLLFLGIYGLFFGETTGGSFYKTLITGAYQSTREIFLDWIEKILEKGYSDALPEYITWRYQKDYLAECKRKLLSVRLFNSHILELTEEDIEKLHIEPIEKHWGESSPYPNKIEYFSRLSDSQYVLVKAIMNGEINIDYIDDYNFFLMDSKNSNGSLVTRIKKTESRKLKTVWQQRLSKIALIALFALIGAGVAVDKASGQGNIGTIINLMQRLSVLTTSIVCGFNTARILNQEDIEVLKYKSSYLSVFYSSIDNKQFIPTDYEEKAKQEYDNLHKNDEIEDGNVFTNDSEKETPI